MEVSSFILLQAACDHRHTGNPLMASVLWMIMSAIRKQMPGGGECTVRGGRWVLGWTAGRARETGVWNFRGESVVSTGVEEDGEEAWGEGISDFWEFSWGVSVGEGWGSWSSVLLPLAHVPITREKSEGKSQPPRKIGPGEENILFPRILHRVAYQGDQQQQTWGPQAPPQMSLVW